MEWEKNNQSKRRQGMRKTQTGQMEQIEQNKMGDINLNIMHYDKCKWSKCTVKRPRLPFFNRSTTKSN